MRHHAVGSGAGDLTVSAAVTNALAVAVFLLASGGCQLRAGKIPSDVRPEDRLSVAALYFSGHDTAIAAMYEEEQSRLKSVCPPPWPNREGCVTRNLRPSRHRIATLQAQPRAHSSTVGHIHAVLRATSAEFDALSVGLDLEFTRQPGKFHEWIANIGDSSYGVHIDGNVREFGAWVQLVVPVVPGPAWMPIETSDVMVRVHPFPGHVLELDSLRARLPDGTSRLIDPGSYLITGVNSERVEFRGEVASDFACGQDVRTPEVLPPLLQAIPAEFFSDDGAPRFTTKYGRGC
jgi:hypothetical protein